jgi:hypothetical protein
VQGRLTGDPACAFGPDRTAFVAALGGDITVSGQDDSYTFVYSSQDGGESWKDPIRLSHTDREFLTVDTTDKKYRGRVYLNATGIVKAIDDETVYGENMAIGVAFFHSQDKGVSFEGPVRVLSSGGRYVLGMGNGVVLSDGLYAAIFGEQLDRKIIADARPAKANAALKVVTSEDGGGHFARAVTVSDWFMNYGEINGSASVVPTIAVDASAGPFRDRLYAVWPDYRSGRGEILLSTSSDRAKTWSKPTVVNDDPAVSRRDGKKGPDNSLPVVAVNSSGVVAVSWYDRRDDPKNLAWTQRMRSRWTAGRPSDRACAYRNLPTTRRGPTPRSRSNPSSPEEPREWSSRKATRSRCAATEAFISTADTRAGWLPTPRALSTRSGSTTVPESLRFGRLPCQCPGVPSATETIGSRISRISRRSSRSQSATLRSSARTA